MFYGSCLSGSDAELAEILARVPQLIGEGEQQGRQVQLVQEAAQGKHENVRDILTGNALIVSC